MFREIILFLFTVTMAVVGAVGDALLGRVGITCDLLNSIVLQGIFFQFVLIFDIQGNFLLDLAFELGISNSGSMFSAVSNSGAAASTPAIAKIIQCWLLPYT